MRRWTAAAAAVLMILLGLHAVGTPVAKAAAGHTVGYDKYSMILDGKRELLWAGEFHYWRLPSPDLWRDVLQKMKAAGFNATSIYFHWGYHSPKPGEYDFTGVRDVDKLLDIAAEVGIYVIARPGPYIHAETSSGGFPSWLKFQTGVARSDAPDYLAAAKDWLHRIDTIIARHQYTNGTGTVIAYQVENEFYLDRPTYMQALMDQARADGITVPTTGNQERWTTGVGAVDLPGTRDEYPNGFSCPDDGWGPLPTLDQAGRRREQAARHLGVRQRLARRGRARLRRLPAAHQRAVRAGVLQEPHRSGRDDRQLLHGLRRYVVGLAAVAALRLLVVRLRGTHRRVPPVGTEVRRDETPRLSRPSGS